MNRVIILMIFISASWLVNAQQAPKKEVDFERLVDEIFSIQDEDINYEDLYENLAQLYSNQADLNSITEEQLRSIFILNEIQLQSFLNYRADAGPFLSVYELQNIEGFTQEIIERFIPFVTVADITSRFNKNLFKRIAEERNNYLILRYDRTLEDKKGYLQATPASSRYLGSPDRVYTRFQTRRTGDFSLGFTIEKDAGEQLTWAPGKKQYGADFISFHAQVLNKGKIKNVILGDFQAQFGQGLALGSAFGIGKNSEAVTTVRRGNLGFLPYTSVYEARYLRGAAISYSLSKKFTMHGMFSSKWRDGSIKQDTTEELSESISSFQFTGLHRTPSEVANRNTVQENNIAGILQYKHKALDAGVLLHHTQFSIPLSPAPNLYNQFSFRSNANTNAGLFLNYSWKNFAFFSEAAYTVNHGTGVVAGIIGSITAALDISLLYRKYDRDFYSFYSNALSENTNPQNENGMYWGWKYQFNKKYSFSGYFDLFQFPWLRYRSYIPSEGSEWLMRFNYKPSKAVSMFLQARAETKIRNSAIDNNLYLTNQGTKRNYWINVDYQITPQLSFKTRAQFSTYFLDDQYSQGMMILQDVVWNSGRFSISGRYALFDTDDYDNRLYVYEKDVWLAFSFPAYYGVGVRNYLLFQYSISKKIDIWVRWAHVRFTDRSTIGSGNESIAGNIRNDVKFQTRIRF